MNRKPSRRSVIGGLAASGLITAPSLARAADADDWQAGAPPEWGRVLKAAQAEGQITVAGQPALADRMAAGFKRDTGITLNFLGGKPQQLGVRFEQEVRAKSLTIDVLIGGGQELVLIPEGLLQPLRPQLLLPGVAPEHFRDGKHVWMDKAGKYLLQGANYVFGWLIVDKNVVKPEELKSWKDLLDPKFRGRIASFDLSGPGPGQGAATWISATFGIDYIKALFLGQQVKFTSDTRALVEGVVRGTTPIAFGAIQQQVERFREAGFDNLAVVLPDDGPGYLTGGFSILKQGVGAPHPNAATVFINWYMSRPGQEIYESIMLETSTRTDVHTGIPDYLVPRPGVKYYFNDEAEYLKRFEMVKMLLTALGR